MARAWCLAIALAACKADEPDREHDGWLGSEDCVQLELHPDSDGDSYGASETVLACPGAGFVADGSDCDDDERDVHPGADDRCDGRDDDCDGEDGDPLPWYADTDGDGFGAAADETSACAAPDGFVANADDCDDGSPSVHPGAVEDCDNAIDDDCDGVAADEIDHDGDGSYSDVCPGGTDCEEFDADIHVGAKETCGDGIDSDCSGADLLCDFPFWGTYDLADASAVVIDPPTEGSDAGRLVKTGDVTGDGIDDILTGTLWAHDLRGGGWVVPGPVSGTVALEDVGYDFAASKPTAGAGRSIAIGDANADGIGDVAFGCPYSAFAPGQYIVFGPITSDEQIADAADAAIVSSEIGIMFAHGSDLGDIDGDGTLDSAIGAWAHDSGAIQSGTVWVTFGPLMGDLDPDDADAMIEGEHELSAAARVVHADTDIDADGLHDILVNAAYDSTAGPSAGAVYVVYGPADIGSLADATMLVGTAPYAFTGQAVTSGDYDGDGYGEVAAYAMAPGTGGVYLARGPLAAETDLAAADVVLEATGDDLGSGLASGDLDGDGTPELLVGAPSHDSARGIAYVVVDPPSGTSAITDVAIATFVGESAGSYAGQDLAAGDLNGDGSNDVVVGAPSLMGSGGVYVEYAGF